MKISDLVKFRQDLINKKSKLSIHNEIQRVRNVIAELTSDLAIESILHQGLLEISDRYSEVKKLSDAINKDVDPLIEKVEKKIDQMSKEQFGEAHAQQLEHFFLDGDHMKYYIKPEIDDLVKVRLKHYTDWRFATLQFGCRYSGERPRLPKEVHKTLGSAMNEPTILHQFTDHLVVGDPLYVCDFKEDFINASIEGFHEQYQRRIAKYIVKDHSEFNLLPKNQFSFVAVWNMFNFVPLDKIIDYVQELYKLLTPGGTIMFNYNNGDDYKSAVLSEGGMMSFVPLRMLKPRLEKIGLTVNRTYTLPNELEQGSWMTMVSWIEASKPGKLQTSKAHQAMGKILVEKEEPKPKAEKRKLDTEELEKLYKQAAELKIDHITRLRAGNYDAETLERMIKQKLAKPK